MNSKNNNLTIFVIMGTIFFTIFLCPSSFAAEGTSKARIIWDNIMLFVNFGILVAAFIKFGKTPLVDFLQGERKKVREKIEAIEDQLHKADSLMKAEADKFASIDERIKETREQIIALGEKEKQRIIEKAELLAHHMIEDARNEAEYRLEKAKKTYGAEMLETAVSIALGDLESRLTQEDDEDIVKKMVDQFSIGLDAGKQRLA
jgi:F-type H+-transporting ATPase subunit b